jgi:hypothetical protein
MFSAACIFARVDANIGTLGLEVRSKFMKSFVFGTHSILK